MTMRPNVPGIRWSRYIYMTVSGLAGLDVCGSLCLLEGNLTCHYYLYTGGICYLGNILTNKSVIAQRSDSQNIYIATGE